MTTYETSGESTTDTIPAVHYADAPADVQATVDQDCGNSLAALERRLKRAVENNDFGQVVEALRIVTWLKSQPKIPSVKTYELRQPLSGIRRQLRDARKFYHGEYDAPRFAPDYAVRCGGMMGSLEVIEAHLAAIESLIAEKK